MYKTILEALHTADCWEAIVSAEDINARQARPGSLSGRRRQTQRPSESLVTVVEDALHGIEAARAAGMKASA